jgi:hypothetical protein
MEPMEQTDMEGGFLLMSLGFIACIVVFSIYGEPLNGDRRLENIVNTFNLVIVIYVVLALHILYPASWGKYVLRILLGYIGGKLIMTLYGKDD